MARHKEKEKTMPRRDFVKSAAAGVAGLAAASIPASSYARILGANDRVRVGIVGFSDRFRQALLPAFKAAGPTLNFEIVAVCDIWNRRRDEGVAEIERSEEHTSELQSLRHLVCRLLLEKKNNYPRRSRFIYVRTHRECRSG